MSLVRVSVLAPDDILRDFGAGALIRLERAATVDGAYAEIDTDAVVAGTYSYELFDGDGASNDWYRVRYSTAAPTLAAHYSAYGDPFSPGSPEAYATLDDLLLTMGQPVSDTRFLANAERRLREATLDLDREIGYTALRTTGSIIINGRGGSVLHVHRGIVSLSAVDIRLSTGGAWTGLGVQDTGWFLEGHRGDPEAIDGLYYHLRLPDTSAYSTFPDVTQGIRLTGVFGGDAEARRAACVAWARQRMALDPANPGGVMSGPEDLGGAVQLDRWPRVVYDLIASERHRFWCHV